MVMRSSERCGRKIRHRRWHQHRSHGLDARRCWPDGSNRAHTQTGTTNRCSGSFGLE